MTAKEWFVILLSEDSVLLLSEDFCLAWRLMGLLCMLLRLRRGVANAPCRWGDAVCLLASSVLRDVVCW